MGGGGEGLRGGVTGLSIDVGGMGVGRVHSGTVCLYC